MEHNGINDGYWKALLKLAQSTNSDGDAKEMKPEDREFLEKVMSETVRKTDPNVQMANYIRDLRTLTNLSDESVNIIGDIINLLENIVCQIDYACNFCKMGGIEEILRLMLSGSNSVKAEGIRLIPYIAQNNPKAQEYIAKTALLENLLTLLTSEISNSAVKGNCLSAVSSIVRGNETLLMRLVQLNGISIFKKTFEEAISAKDMRIANKTAIIFTNIVLETDEKSAVSLGFRDVLFEIFCDLPLTLDACTYVRQRFAETGLYDGLKQETLNKILEKMMEHLKSLTTTENDDQEEVEELLACIEAFTAFLKIEN